MKIKANYFLTQGSYLGIGHAISVICGFLLSIAFARFLSKEIYGQYRYILSVMAILIIFTLPGLKTAIIQATARGFEGSFKRGIKTRLKWGTLTSLASLGLAIYFWLQGNIEFTIAFLIAGILFPVSASFNLYLSYLAGKQLFKIKVKYESIVRILTLIALAITLFLTNNLIILILVYFFSEFLFNSILLIRTLKKFPPNIKRDPKTIPYGKRLTLVGVSSLIITHLDKILFFHFLGPVEVAVYSFAAILPEQIKSLLKNIRFLALPRFSNQEITPFTKKKILSLFYKLLGLIMVIILIYIFIVPWIFKLFYPQYINSVPYSKLYILTLISFPGILFGLFFQAQRKIKQIWKLNLIGGSLHVILLFILIPVFGIWGAIWARIINGVLISLVFAFFLFKKL